MFHGAKLAQHKIDESPISDGMIVADSQLYICTEQGAVICMADDESEAGR